MTTRWGISLGAIALLSLIAFSYSSIADNDCFSRSLHATGEGMRYWYEEAGGFMTVTGIPYSELDCSNCHIRSCDVCHATTDDEEATCSFSVSKAKKMDTCLPCHGREKTTFARCKERGSLDVHVAAGYACSDCHGMTDVHGDGKEYQSMRAPGALKTSCGDCHEYGEDDIQAHKVHKGKLACAACHVENTMACMNCHMDTFLRTGSRKGTFFPMDDWLLLMNYEGQVTSATAMTLVYQGKRFICYAPYFTHAVQSQGRECGDCHANEAVKLIQAGDSVPMMTYENGKVESWKGVVPVTEGKLEWVYLDKKADGWVPLTTSGDEVVQHVGYGTPLTETQLKKMAKSFTRR